MTAQPNSYSGHVEKDAATGDLMLPFSEEFLKNEDWRSGDVIRFEDVKTGSFVLRNLSKDDDSHALPPCTLGSSVGPTTSRCMAWTPGTCQCSEPCHGACRFRKMPCAGNPASGSHWMTTWRIGLNRRDRTWSRATGSPVFPAPRFNLSRGRNYSAARRR